MSKGELEDRYYMEGSKGPSGRLVNDLVRQRGLVSHGVVNIVDGRVNGIDLYLSDGRRVESDVEKVIKLRGLLDDLVKEIEFNRERGIGL